MLALTMYMYLDYNAIPQTQGGVDYDATVSQLTFSASQSRACAEIPITDDIISEPMEVFAVSLSFLDDLMSGPEGITIMPDSANISIIDDDGESGGGGGGGGFSFVGCDMTLSFTLID